MDPITPFPKVPRRLKVENHPGPLGPYLEGFRASLAPIGYTPGSLANLLRGAMVFSYRLAQQGITDVSRLTDQHVRDFVASTPLTLLHGTYPVHESLAAR